MKVLITGAGGVIGRQITAELNPDHELTLIDRSPIPGHSSFRKDLSRSRRSLRPGLRGTRSWWSRAFSGCEVVVHLAARTSPESTWKEVCRHNIRATANTLEAAAAAGVGKIIFASSTWSVRGREDQLAPECYSPGGPSLDSAIEPRPAAPYGFSKAVGEMLGRSYLDRGLFSTFLSIRLGWCPPDGSGRTSDPILQRRWIGLRDLRTFFRCCVEKPIEGYHVLYAISAQPSEPFDLTHTRHLLGWEPEEVPG